MSFEFDPIRPAAAAAATAAPVSITSSSTNSRQNGGKHFWRNPKRGASLDNELSRSIEDEELEVEEELVQAINNQVTINNTVNNGGLNSAELEYAKFTIKAYQQRQQHQQHRTQSNPRAMSSLSENASQLLMGGPERPSSHNQQLHNFRFSNEEISDYRQNTNNTSEPHNNTGGRTTRATTPGDEQIFQEPIDSLQMRIGRLLSCEEMADMHFLVSTATTAGGINYDGQGGSGLSPIGKKLRIPAHKLIMATASPVFKQALYNANINLMNGTIDEIEICDLDPQAFLEFLRYAYTDSARLSKDNAVGVLVAACRYQMTNLENQAIEHIQRCLSKKACLAIWIAARSYRLHDLEQIALRSVQHYAEGVLLCSDFVKLDQQSLCELLSDDLLRADEIVVFRALTRWGKQACHRAALCPTRANVRSFIGSALNLIRFPLMSEEQLQRMVAAEGILDDELLRALVHCSRTWPRASNLMMRDAQLSFSNEPRAYQRLNGKLHNVHRFGSFENTLTNHYLNRSLNFLTNKRIWLAGVALYAPRKACTFYLNVNVCVRRSDAEVTDRNNSRWQSPLDKVEQTLLLKFDGTTHLINVNFDEPLQIEANVQYEITASITPTTRSTSLVRARLHPHLYYTRPNEVNFYYGTEGQYASKVKINTRSENVIFNFNWDRDNSSVQDDSISIGESIVGGVGSVHVPPSASAPTTPNLPPRPPPPKEYRRPSRMQRLRRALSFIDRREDINAASREAVLHEGQIPVLMFYA